MKNDVLQPQMLLHCYICEKCIGLAVAEVGLKKWGAFMNNEEILQLVLQSFLC